MNGSLRATVLIPTIKNRGPLLPYSVGSVLAQTVSDIEVFVMGDGVDNDTRAVIQDLMAHDSRIKFFDNPKHRPRGEPNRHQALTEARGKIVCYLCDRDLMLPNHIEIVEDLLTNTDFCHTLISYVEASVDNIKFVAEMDLSNASDRRWVLAGRARCIQDSIPLSFAAHTLDMYRKLPHGWRTTPDDIYTDIYMWEQFLSHSECRAASGMVPTILYFPRGRRTEWSVNEKLAELEHWSERIKLKSWNTSFLQTTINALAQDQIAKARQLRVPFVRRAYWKLRENVGLDG